MDELLRRMPRRTTAAARLSRLVVTYCLVALFIVAIGEGASAQGPSERPQANGRIIPDQYIVVFQPGTARADGLARNLVAAHRGRLLATYQHALPGFAAQLPPQAVQALQHNPHVAYIERDQLVTVADTQINPPWNLDRVDQRTLPLNNRYTYTQTGSGVRAYILDTGIHLTHNEFDGRAVAAYDAITPGGGATDCHGHGTHVAGIVGGNTYGVAKEVLLYAVRVLGCDGTGSVSAVIAGVDWVTANHVKPAVANMSLGRATSDALDAAVANSIEAGVSYVVAAGNSNDNACNYSPARIPGALTVGASTPLDARAFFSNYGSCVDLFAPGVDIASAWSSSDTAVMTLSGTSEAAPHVTGVAALYLQHNPNASPAAVHNVIVGSATTGVLSDIGPGSPNRLLYSPLTGGSPPSPPPPPPPPSYQLFLPLLSKGG